MRKRIKSDLSFDTLSNREFIMILILIVIIVSVLLYNFILKPRYDVYRELKDRYKVIETQTNALEKEYSKKNIYQEEINQLDNEIINQQVVFPPTLNQEELIKLIDKYEKMSDVNVSLAGFSPIETTPSSNIKDAVIKSMDINISFQGNYEQLYEFINYLENNERKLFIKSIQMNSKEFENVIATINISYKAYISKYSIDNTTEQIQEIEKRDNIFRSFDGYYDEKTNSTVGTIKYNNPNFYIFINSSLNIENQVEMGKTTSSQNKLVYLGNDVANASLIINDDFSYMLKLNENEYSGYLEQNEENDNILLKVISEIRKSSDDNVSLSLTVENYTNKTLEIVVLNDKQTNPRLILDKAIGDVTLIKLD